MRDLLPRTVTAIIAMTIVILALYLGRLWNNIWPVACLGALVTGIAAWEYAQLLERNGVSLYRFLFIGSAMAVVFAYGTPAGAFGDLIFWLALISPIFIYLFDPDALRKILATMGGIIYIPYLLHFFYPLYRAPDGFLYGLLALSTVWGYDIGAYITGSLWGRHKLAPAISPHKSWEGVVGGFALSALITAAVPIWSNQENAWIHILLLALLVSAFAQSGDLLESQVKRFARVKDAGGVMPGHGGLLDRIDGLLLALPAIYFYFHLVLRLV